MTRGFVEDESLGILTFSIFVSMLSMVKNIFSVYADSKTYDDMNFIEYVVSIMSATFDQGGSMMKNAAEIRDGLMTVSRTTVVLQAVHSCFVCCRVSRGMRWI